ncbi:L-sorbose 1-dehydrogenase [Fulvia fulva]|uniref:L-sorbose 1-dehydrogenase n=1 Tax=Passalora fulva TaxID=5499 RepID=A0A9Q8PBW4_PASFU|nr:L-sorbose 1-dehydrogenase [Fulvia fulva]KAK4620939.1 L-sorbose 1-dehydrogenase [Fulvia fulva]UJO19610.1 L-sorbose 1-dehydrogenase [Fulvia fulva]WPV17404.1 L-sorbose 1-dehydrogenase [Fulvia fulva]WPV32040.1 L-sorbose 1-dehydrogenase [Fulvia fulva]
MFESFQSKGMPYDADMFSHGNTVQGCGHAMRTTCQGYRATAADYVTKDQQRPNVKIRCDVTVDKVVTVKGTDRLLEANGVEYVDANGNRFSVNASRKVIVTAGTYCSPAVLMRSGIGPKAELEALDIPVQLDLPGVGENLQDHQLMWTYYESSDPTLTDDARINHDPDAYNTAHKEWTESKSGFMAVFPFGAFGFARLSERLDKENSPASEEWRSFPREEGRDPMSLTANQPNLEFFNTVGYGGPPEYTDFPKEGQHAFGMCCFLCGLKGRGKGTIKTKDPITPPFVNPRYLEDRRDLLMMTEGVRFANEIVMEGAGTKNVVKGAWPPGAKHHLNKINEDWQPFVRERCSTSYHPGGTAKLSKRDHEELAGGRLLDYAHVELRTYSNASIWDC